MYISDLNSLLYLWQNCPIYLTFFTWFVFQGTLTSNFQLPTTNSATQRGKPYDINRRAVYHATESGSGYKGLATFCGIMNMPCLSKPAYKKQVDNILEALEDEAKEEMRKAGARFRRQILEENPEKDQWRSNFPRKGRKPKYGMKNRTLRIQWL